MIFFFKQKTAYEMVRSDWSSDVCSSDLAQNREVLGLIERTPLWGRGISWVDAHLLTAALLDQIQIWTLDRPLHAAAQELGVAF